MLDCLMAQGLPTTLHVAQVSALSFSFSLPLKMESDLYPFDLY